MNLLDVNDRPGEYPPSFYAAQADHLARMPPARGEIRTDVCVIGAGFTGLSTAYHLAARGYDVRLLEAQRIGFGASGRNGGQVGQGQRRDQDELEALYGKTHAKELWSIGMEAVELVRELAARPEIRATFHPGILHADHRARFVTHSRSHAEFMRTEYDYEHIRFVDRDEIRDIVGSPAYFGGTLDTRSGHIDPLELALGLARLAGEAGATLHEGSRVLAIDEGAQMTVTTDKARIAADHVVLACNGYVGNLHNDVTRRVMPINNYIVATEPLDYETRRSILRDNIAVADSKFVVNYFRFSDDDRLLFGGTETYGYRFPRDIAAQVRRPMTQIFPQLAETRIDHAWGGTLGITLNRLPHYATYGGRILSMSGFSGQGVALGTLSGQIAAEAIAGQAERFDVMARLNTPEFPGGRHFQYPLMVLGMLWYGLRDRL